MADSAEEPTTSAEMLLFTPTETAAVVDPAEAATAGRLETGEHDALLTDPETKEM
jgi:hypothetical protein